MKDTTTILCPYCSQPNEIYIDYSGGYIQNYIEDCQVCCRPWQVHIEIAEDEPIVYIKTDSE